VAAPAAPAALPKTPICAPNLGDKTSLTGPKMAEAAILEQCRLHPDGIPDAELAAAIAHIPVGDRAQAINRLLSTRKLQIFKDGDAIVYREVKQDEAVKCVLWLQRVLGMGA